MIVLLDIEWVGDLEKHMTQLSAMRVTPDWWTTERLDILVRPADGWVYDPDHVACGGYPEARFAEGVSEQEGVVALSRWLRPDDDIWVWSASNLRYFQELWGKYVSGDVPAVSAQSGRARGFAARRGLPGNAPYDLLAALGMDPPFPGHRSSNDVEVMRRLFSGLNLRPRPGRPTPPPAPKPQQTRRDRNRIWLKKVPFNYIYVAGSGVFHRRECKHYLNGKLLLGSKYYATAANGRRPCKFCNPTPPPPLPLPKAGMLSKATAGIEALRKKRNEIVKTKLVSGAVQEMRMGKIIGWCHCSLHPGAVDKCILEQHRCLKKECYHFQKNEASTYWEALENEQRAKQKQKAAKERRSREAEALRITKDTWQSYIHELDSDMTTVRVAQPTPWMYTVFYVSDNPFADGNRYPAFLQRIKSGDPQVKICLRHIRAIDGSFVTTDQYRARPR